MSREDTGAGDAAVPERDLFLRISIPTQAGVSDETIATLFRLEEVHAEKGVDGVKVVSTFAYLDPEKHPDLMRAFSVRRGASSAGYNRMVSRHIQLYGPPDTIDALCDALERAPDLPESEGGKEGGPPAEELQRLGIGAGPPEGGKGGSSPLVAGMGLYLPGGGGRGDEYLQVSLLEMRGEGEFAHLYVENYAVVKRENDVLDDVRAMAKSEDITYLFDELRKLLSKIPAPQAAKSQSPLLNCGDPEEMVKIMLGVERLGGGLVKMPREGDPGLKLTARREDFSELAKLLRGVNERPPGAGAPPSP